MLLQYHSWCWMFASIRLSSEEFQFVRDRDWCQVGWGVCIITVAVPKWNNKDTNKG